VRATNVVLRGNVIGLWARVGKLTDVVASENLGNGLVADRLRLTNVEASANSAEGILATTMTGADVRVEGNLGGFGGVVASKVSLTRATVTGNGGDGIRAARHLLVRDGVVTGNAGTDLSVPRRPRVIETTCGSSSDQQGGDWDVCAND
jgi:hypothetical protein